MRLPSWKKLRSPLILRSLGNLISDNTTVNHIRTINFDKCFTYFIIDLISLQERQIFQEILNKLFYFLFNQIKIGGGRTEDHERVP